MRDLIRIEKKVHFYAMLFEFEVRILSKQKNVIQNDFSSYEIMRKI